MKKINIITLLFAVLCITIANSCKKIDTLQNQDLISEKEIIEKFTAIPQGQNPILQKIANKIKQDNEQAHFIADLANRVGYPIWTASEIRKPKNNFANRTESDEDYELAFIPLSLPNSNEVDGFLACKVFADSVKINLYEDKDYALYGFNKPSTEIDAEDIALMSMYLDFKTFGYKNFEVSDFNLFNTLQNSSDTIIKSIYANFNSSSNVEEASACVTTWSLHCPGCTNCNDGSGSCCNNCWERTVNCYSFTLITYDDPSTWNGGGSYNSSSGYNPNLNGWWVGSNTNGNIGWEVGLTSVEIAMINNLKNQLNLTEIQTYWLSKNIKRAERISNYLLTSTNIHRQKIASEHQKKMMNDNNYFSFVLGHENQNNNNIIWWEDDAWLSNPLNFSLAPESGIYGEFKELTFQEKVLTGLYPLQAIIINSNREKADNFTKQFMGFSGLNDKSDAFRHCFFNAINQRDCGYDLVYGSLANIAKLFGDAHESETPSQRDLEKQMDLWNNYLGYHLITNNSATSNVNNDIADKVKQYVNNGLLKYIKNTLPPCVPNKPGICDPHFYGVNGTQDKNTATHGITSNSYLVRTNQ